jgi:hypothetical protein
MTHSFPRMTRSFPRMSRSFLRTSRFVTVYFDNLSPMIDFMGGNFDPTRWVGLACVVLSGRRITQAE